MDLSKVFDVDEFQELAERAMDPGAFAYYLGASEREITRDDNAAAFDRFRFRPRVLRGVVAADTSTTLLDAEVSLPIGLSPAALQKLAHPDGEPAAARAASAAGAMQIVSTESSYSIEDVAAASTGPRWFQLYMNKDMGITKELIARAGDAGYGAIVLTVDLTIPGFRPREHRVSFTPPPEAGPGSYKAEKQVEMAERIANQYGDARTWDDIEWLRAQTHLPIVLKGIMTAEDGALAVEHGADAIIVSNHGGRQLDRSQATIDVLGEVVEAVEDQVEVYLDGGVRRGTDVLIARALGARAVFVGRPYLWGLAAGGEAGVARVLAIMRDQLVNGMINLGIATLDEMTRDHLA